MPAGVAAMVSNPIRTAAAATTPLFLCIAGVLVRRRMHRVISITPRRRRRHLWWNAAHAIGYGHASLACCGKHSRGAASSDPARLHHRAGEQRLRRDLRAVVASALPVADNHGSGTVATAVLRHRPQESSELHRDGERAGAEF